MIKSALVAVALLSAPSALAQSPSNPPPPMPGPTASAGPYMQIAGEGDVYEVTSSEIALKRAKSGEIKRLAGMLIEHHTTTTNVLLTQAKAAGLAPPPAVLGQGKREWIDALLSAPPSDFDRIFLEQQIPAHEAALAVNQAYAETGDTPELKVAAAGATPVVEKHLAQLRQLAGRR